MSDIYPPSHLQLSLVNCNLLPSAWNFMPFTEPLQFHQKLNFKEEYSL